jgi:hypothetical protein
MTLQTRVKALAELDQDIETLTTPGEELEGELESAAEYDEMANSAFSALHQILEHHKSAVQAKQAAALQVAPRHHTPIPGAGILKLPKLSLPEFTGNFRIFGRLRTNSTHLSTVTPHYRRHRSSITSRAY